MNITTLKSKWYYRLLVVIYIGLFLTISTVGIAINFNSVGTYQTDYEIKCFYGNKETFFAYQDKNILVNRYAKVINTENWSSNEDPNDRSVLGVATKGCGLSEQSAQKLLSTGSNIFDAKLKKVNITTYGSATLWSIFAILIIALVFEFTKRIFYYIVSGTLFPKK